MAATRVPEHEDPAVHEFLAAGPARQAEVLAAWGHAPAVALVLHNSCENRCFFCASPGTIAVPASEITPWDRVAAHLDARPDGVRKLLVGGNEPTLHPSFERALARAWDAGFDHVELMTSGLRFDASRLARWIARGLRSVAVPIYGSRSSLHDAVCGTPCFDRLVAGLDAAREAGLAIHLHTLALRRTIDDLPRLAELARDRWGSTLGIAPLRDKPLFAWGEESVPLGELTERLAALRVPVGRMGLPTCVGRHLDEGGAEVVRVYFRTQRRGFAAACEACLDRPACAGVVAAELARGAPGLSPRR
jgi:molybdenum cofactor biosynthesis enzyme MoaA